MKKVLAVLSAFALVLAMASCGETAETSSEATSTAAPVSTAAPTVAPTVEPTPAPTEKPVDTLNLALQGTAIASSVTEAYAAVTNGVEALNDGDHSTRWQANSDKELDADGNVLTDESGNEISYLESEEHPTWLGIQWEEAKTFDTIVCDWENAHPLEDGFYVEISDDGETWTKVDFTSVRTGTENDGAETLDADHQVDTITLKEAATAKAVRVYCFTYYTVPEGHENAGNTKSPTSCYEMEISYSVDVAAAAEEASAEETSVEEE